MASRIPNSADVIQTYTLNSTYFFIDTTKMIFPRLTFDKYSIPVGNSFYMCLTASWAALDRNTNQ